MTLKKLTKAAADLKKAKDKLRSLGSRVDTAAIEEAFAPCFAGNSKIHAIHWTQYTPYFNDGEPCTFRVGDQWIFNEEMWEAERGNRYKEGDGIWELDDPEMIAKYGKTALKACGKLFDQLDQEVLRVLFGDHVQITITRDGVEIDEYEHD